LEACAGAVAPSPTASARAMGAVSSLVVLDVVMALFPRFGQRSLRGHCPHVRNVSPASPTTPALRVSLSRVPLSASSRPKATTRARNMHRGYEALRLAGDEQRNRRGSSPGGASCSGLASDVDLVC